MADTNMQDIAPTPDKLHSTTPAAKVPKRKGLFNHKPYSVSISYGNDTMVVPPRGRIQKVDVSLLPKELPDGLVVFDM